MKDTSDKRKPERKAYETPKIEVQGRVEDLTKWVGGAWGEMLSGESQGWNPWLGLGS